MAAPPDHGGFRAIAEWGVVDLVLTRLVLPLLAVAGAVAMVALEIKALFAPALPLAIIQLLILPFRRGRRVTNG